MDKSGLIVFPIAWFKKFALLPADLTICFPAVLTAFGGNNPALDTAGVTNFAALPNGWDKNFDFARAPETD